ncbi:MAG: YceI family protein [Vicinamibacterales bacterium]
MQCPLTIGGSFEARTKLLSGSVMPGPTPADPWAGQFIVDLTALDTGISLRNQHLRDNYLEVGKGPDFARAVLSDVRLSGIAGAEPVGKGTFTARLRLHGAERAVTGQAELRRSGSGIRVRASFPVVLEEFGIAKPRYLGVGVKEQVTVQVTFEASSGENAR